MRAVLIRNGHGIVHVHRRIALHPLERRRAPREHRCLGHRREGDGKNAPRAVARGVFHLDGDLPLRVTGVLGVVLVRALPEEGLVGRHRGGSRDGQRPRASRKAGGEPGRGHPIRPKDLGHVLSGVEDVLARLVPARDLQLGLHQVRAVRVRDHEPRVQHEGALALRVSVVGVGQGHARDVVHQSHADRLGRRRLEQAVAIVDLERGRPRARFRGLARAVKAHRPQHALVGRRRPEPSHRELLVCRVVPRALGQAVERGHAEPVVRVREGRVAVRQQNLGFGDQAVRRHGQQGVHLGHPRGVSLGVGRGPAGRGHGGRGEGEVGKRAGQQQQEQREGRRPPRGRPSPPRPHRRPVCVGRHISWRRSVRPSTKEKALSFVGGGAIFTLGVECA